MKILLRSLFLPGLMTLLAGSSGCSSTPKQAAGFLASVQLEGQTRVAIQQAVEKVFLEKQYEVIRMAPEMVFDKRAGTMKMLAYGNLGGGNVFNRVKVTIKNDGVGGHVIGANVYVVRDRGDPVFEDEQKLLRIGGGDYQQMLDEVKTRLNP